MSEPSLIRLSQGHLNLLETCPPQFQRLYLEEKGTPISPDQQDSLLWGSQFHLLMQQQELGLSIESLLAQDQQLDHSISALLEATADIWQPSATAWREAEHYRALKRDNYLLTVIYDLLLIEQNQAQILDWKTYLEPQNKTKILNHWQTRLYPYVLAETSEIHPDQISMTYWFVKLPTKPQSLTLNYSQKQHEQNHRDLQNLLQQLSEWLEKYETQEFNFPHCINCQDYCPYAEFLVSNSQENEIIAFDSIEEVVI